jgi:flagellar hook protein FlgE
MQVGLDSTSPVIAAAWNGTSYATAAATSNYATAATVYDSLGAAHKLQVYFKDNGGGAWEWHALADGGEITGGTAGTPVEVANGTLTFTTAGLLQAQTSVSVGANFTNNATPGQAITFNFGNDIASGGAGTGSSSQATPFSVDSLSIDGRSAGHLTDVNITADGVIQGTFDNGDHRDLAQVAMALFGDQQGLNRAGDSLLAETDVSGQALVDVAASGGRGARSSGALEASNVALGNELVALIAYQRAFQANSKTVTTADEMMTEVNNLKR